MRRSKERQRKQKSYTVGVHGHALVVAARAKGTISLDQAASLVHAGARKLRVALPVPATREDAEWREGLYAASVKFFVDAAIAASARGVADVLGRDGVAHLPASSFSAAAAEFVTFLRTRAPEQTAGYEGATMVDGRIKCCVPSAYVICSMLLAFARALRPECFPDTLTADMCEISVIYLTLLASSKDQKWHHDYLKYKDAVVFLVMLDPGEGSTEFEVGGATRRSPPRRATSCPSIRARRTVASARACCAAPFTSRSASRSRGRRLSRRVRRRR